MFGMTTMERSGTPADIAAERAAIEAEIEGTTLLTAYAETVAAAGDTRGAPLAGRRGVAVADLPPGA